MDSPLPQDIGFASVASSPFRGTPVSTAVLIARTVPVELRVAGNATGKVWAEIVSAKSQRAKRSAYLVRRVALEMNIANRMARGEAAAFTGVYGDNAPSRNPKCGASTTREIAVHETQSRASNCVSDSCVIYKGHHIAIAVRSAKTREVHDGPKCQKLVDLSKMIRETGTSLDTCPPLLSP